jgi:NAD(P)H-quinone oxidoreductase subunit 3
MPFDQLLDTYVAVLIGAIIGFILVLTALILNKILAPRYRTREKETAYECGMLPIGSNLSNIHFRYYLYAILFLIFDVEAVFLFPWVVSFADVGKAAFWEMVIFVGILAAGLGYAWRRGVFDWRTQ